MRQVDGQAIASADALETIMRRRKPGDRIEVAYVDRTAGARTATVALAEDPREEVVPVESSGGVLTAAHKSFRDAWLGSAQ